MPSAYSHLSATSGSTCVGEPRWQPADQWSDIYSFLLQLDPMCEPIADAAARQRLRSHCPIQNSAAQLEHEHERIARPVGVFRPDVAGENSAQITVSELHAVEQSFQLRAELRVHIAVLLKQQFEAKLFLVSVHLALPRAEQFVG